MSDKSAVRILEKCRPVSDAKIWRTYIDVKISIPPKIYNYLEVILQIYLFGKIK